MDDFEADTVGLFLTLLADEKVSQIEDRKFKELHKMSVVFEVEWLRLSSLRWLSGRIKIDMDDNEKYFLFEECLFIVKKWDDWDLMNELMVKTALTDHSPFIRRYFKDFDRLETVQLELMLQFGKSDCQLFLGILLQHLQFNAELGVNAKLLLRNMNLALCSELQNELYSEVMEKVAGLAEISTADMKFVLDLRIETSRKVDVRRSIRDSNSASRMQKIHCDMMMTRNREESQTLKDLVKAVEGYWIKSMYEVIDLILWLFHRDPPTKEEIEKFVTELADMACNRTLQKVSHGYLTLIITSLEEHSPSEDKKLLILMLEFIRGSWKLSTTNQNAIIPLTRAIWVRDDERKHCFTYKHPSNAICARSDGGECGFIIRYSYERSYWRNELCVDERDYWHTGLHFHDTVQSKDISIYSLCEGYIEPGNSIIMAIVANRQSSFWREKWFPSITNWKIVQTYVALDMRDHLVYQERWRKSS